MVNASNISRDAKHLRLLSIFHYVAGGFVALCALLAISELRLVGAEPFFVIWLSLLSLGWATLAVLYIQAGRFLAQRRRRPFCRVVAGISCLLIPVGTVLGVLTLIVLSRDSVRVSFDGSGEAEAAG